MTQDNTRKPSTPKQRAPTADVLQAIVMAARKYSVPPYVALAFVDCESGFNEHAEGDIDWPFRRGGELYKKHVLGSPALANNPGRHDPAVWHSYGLFQMLAAYHVKPTEHPHALLDPKVNADRGCALIANLLKRSGGDIERARLAYTGAGFDGEKVAPEVALRTRERIRTALRKWKDNDGIA